MAEQPELTNYQKSLFSKTPLSWKQTSAKWFAIGFHFLLAFGFLAQCDESLPHWLNGWLVFATILLICLKWVGVAVFGILRLAFGFVSFLGHKVCEKAAEEPWDGEVKEASNSVREVIIKWARNINPNYYWKVSTITSFVGDLFLFVMMVSSNHPILATFYGLSLAMIYVLRESCRKKIWEMVATINDPLENDEEVDMDELMDKLTDPDSK